MPAIYLHHLTVSNAEIDRWGHVNNRVYLSWMESAAVDHSSVNGWPPQRYEELGQGWVARSHSIEYLKPGFEGDDVVVRTWIDGFKRVSSLRKYRIERPADGTVLATAQTNWAFVKLSNFAPVRIPPIVSDCFDVIAADDVDSDEQKDRQVS